MKKARPKSEEDEEQPPDINFELENGEENSPKQTNNFPQLKNPIGSSQLNPQFDVDLTNNNFGQGDMASSGEFKKETLDIVLYDQYKENKMVFQNTEVLVKDDEIVLSFLLQKLKTDGFPFDGALISYFDSIQDLYVFCGQDPLDKSITVPMDTIVGSSLEIKVRTKRKDLIEQLIEEQTQKEKADLELENNQNSSKNSHDGNNQKNRVKERKIGEVVEKVALWRRFYTGFFDDKGKFISMPLDDAAKKVGISKKTLDDYLLQIRCGKKYGFKFNAKLKDRIGILRTYVKEQKNKKEKNEK